MHKQMLQELFLAFMLIGYANVAIFCMLLHFTYMRRFRDIFKINGGMMWIVNATFLGIVGGYFLLKYCSQ